MDVKFEDERQTEKETEKKKPTQGLGLNKTISKGNIRKLLILVIPLIVIYAIFRMPIINPIYVSGFTFFYFVFSLIIVLAIGNFKYAKHFLVGYVIALFLIFLATTPIFWSQKYYDLIGDVPTVDYYEEKPNIDEELIPVVDEALAQNLGDKKLGEDIGLSSQFEAGEYYFVNTEEDLAWVAPLEPTSFFKWFQNRAGSPGYIYVSATDPNDVRLVQDIDGEELNLKYTNRSYFFSDIQRHLYVNGYFSKGLMDYSFEIDDQGNPYWIITEYKPSFNVWAGNQAENIIIVDAQTGEMQEYPVDSEDIPSWVERVWPKEMIMEQISYWGAYENGWLNTKLAQKEVIQPTEGNSFVFIEGQPYLYTGLTSIQGDESTVGFILSSVKDKSTTFYKLTGATEVAAMSSAEGQVQQFEYQASFPILLDIYGKPTYFMTLKDKQGLIKQYAFVSVENYNVVGIGDTISKAQSDYYTKLKENNSIDKDAQETNDASGVIDRINYVDGNYFIKLEGSPEIYITDKDISNDIVLTESGDSVKLSYIDYNDNYKELTSFNNSTI